MLKKPVPFTKSFVLKATFKHILRAVDVSIRKTQKRWEEFKDDPDKSREVMETVMRLNHLRTLLVDFQSAHSEEFKPNG